MPNEKISVKQLLEELHAAGVEFIVVGGVAAVIHGALVSTFDLDIVYSRDPQNLVRLERALRELQAVYRMKPEVEPDARRLDGPGHHLTMTRLGPLDLLGSTVGDRGYQELLGHSVPIELEGGKKILILDLPTLIQIKETLARDRDRAVLPILRRTLAERSGKNF